MKLQHIAPDKKYVLAVSGGIDSMVMAHLFLHARLHFHVAHCNFNLRGDESVEDASFVARWCEHHHIQCHRIDFDTVSYAEEHKLSVQEAARALRYTFFDSVRQSESFDWIATAHNSDDQVETMLFQFLRGTGIQGLCGIPVFNDRHIMRPILHCSREDIKAYATEHSIQYREDSSNAKQVYTRNKMRLTVIPMLETMFPNVKQTLLQNQQRFDQTNQIFQQQIERTRRKIMTTRGKDFYFSVLQLMHLPTLPTLMGEILKPYGFSFEQVAQVLHLLESQSGAFVESHSHRVIRHRQHLILTTRQKELTDFLLVQKNDHRIDTENFHVTFHLQKSTEHLHEGNPLHIVVDSEELQYPLQLRKWKQGDYFYPLGFNKKKKVARLLIDEKIPLHEKEDCWVLVSDQKIVWVLGLRMDHRFRVKPTTHETMHIEMTRHTNSH